MKRARLLAAAAAVAAAGLALAATVAPSSPAAHARPAGVAGVAGATVLSNEDNARTVIVPSGEVVQVRLKAIRGEHETWVWDVPAASTPAVLPRTSGTVAPNGDADASFRARAMGRSALAAHRHCRPDRGHVCPQVVIPWMVTVIVR
ncbi:hypothetical protein [Streptomyces sp. UNOC14_S4]|uniref:hypothetical protein n=1 Tax=Streptomyces sp. UNOC14_S4 TaxID=2872340 RepID=UPI001E517297|nr:hypothetical protein [Streptomyces sp. UNOC14_S4]MCC3767840.1 hypothetical protein [Streptomyces sp. UNOC14_S4]